MITPMKPDEFEQQLQQQPLRTIPAEWRAGILRAAHTASQSPRVSARNSLVTSWLLEWLWPCPEAWAGLAALWVVIFALQITAPASVTLASNRTAPASTERIPALAERRRELANLLDAFYGPSPVLRPPTPRPRSEVRAVTVFA